MKLLAIDTSNIVASAAILEDGVIIDEIKTEDQKTHSEKLLPSIDALLKKTNIDISDIDMFAVSVGPGSFTGIRIGVSTIKGIAQALNRKVIAVTSLEGLIQLADTNNVCAIINAKHGNVYYQILNDGKMLTPDCAPIQQVINEILQLNKKITIVGDATEEFKDLLKSSVNCEIFDKTIQTSSNIGKFAWQAYLEDKDVAVIPHKIVPIYLRKAQPDREV